MHSNQQMETGRQSRPVVEVPTIRHGSSRQDNPATLVTADNWARAREVSATVPYLITKDRKHQAISTLLAHLIAALFSARIRADV